MMGMHLSNLNRQSCDTPIWTVGILDPVTERARAVKARLSSDLFNVIEIHHPNDVSHYAINLDAVLAYDSQDALLRFLSDRASRRWVLPVFAYSEKSDWYRVVVTIRRGATDYVSLKSISSLNERVLLACVRGKAELERSYQVKDVSEKILTLTQREHIVASFLSRGLTIKEIAKDLRRSERTIESLAAKIYERLEISGRYALMGLHRHFE